MKEEIRSHRGLVTLRGSRVVKQNDVLKEKNAHTLVFAHRLAREALKPVGVDVRQYKVVQGRRPKINPKNASLFDSENNFFLVSKQLVPTETSRTYFKHMHEHWVENKPYCGPCESCRKHKADYDKISGPLVAILKKAGFTPASLDIGPNNAMFTANGVTLIEVLDEDHIKINPDAEKDFDKHFGRETAEKMRTIMQEYREKMAEIDKRRVERLRQQGIE